MLSSGAKLQAHTNKTSGTSLAASLCATTESWLFHKLIREIDDLVDSALGLLFDGETLLYFCYELFIRSCTPSQSSFERAAYHDRFAAYVPPLVLVVL